MKSLNVFPILLLMFSFGDGKTYPKKTKGDMATNEVQVAGFQSILETANLHGAVLLWDLKEGRYFSNDFIWAKTGHLPASTFKIPNSLKTCNNEDKGRHG